MKLAVVAGVLCGLTLANLAGTARAGSDDATIRQLTARLNALEARYQRVQDVQDLEKLQRIYGYYVERGQLDEVADLFSLSPKVSLDMSGSVSVGIGSVRKMFSTAAPFGVKTPGGKPLDYLHVTAPISGVVDVATDGKTAQGRWYALMFLNNAGMGGGAVWGIGIYENDYIKEEGKWKILHLRFDDLFTTTYDKKGWINSMPAFTQPGGGGPPMGRGRSQTTPFAELMPYHYKHPITGK